ncbi:DUF736 domain-containing protein [Paremcibacter congregatus]|uniref:DUF736 domain-containing protein n=1 Tax=Paremcibacter congregatus TaxID=2043170 RepID=UPI003A8FD1C5
MAQTLGTLTKHGNQFEGFLNMLSIRSRIRILPNEGISSSGAPDYRIYAEGGVEIGGVWERISKRTGKPYLSLTLSAPEFGAHKIYASLAPSGGNDSDRYLILWNPRR